MKIREGGFFVTAIIIMFTIACGVLFNDKHNRHKEKSRHRKKKQKEQIESRNNNSYYKYSKESEEEEKDEPNSLSKNKTWEDKKKAWEEKTYYRYDPKTGEINIKK